jgi:hypothetical protein
VYLFVIIFRKAISGQDNLANAKFYFPENYFAIPKIIINFAAKLVHDEDNYEEKDT